MRSALKVRKSKFRLDIGRLPVFVLFSLGYFLAFIDCFCLAVVFWAFFLQSTRSKPRRSGASTGSVNLDVGSLPRIREPWDFHPH
jgi:hypothetical protein